MHSVKVYTTIALDQGCTTRGPWAGYVLYPVPERIVSVPRTYCIRPPNVLYPALEAG